MCWAHSSTKGSGDCLEKAEFAQRIQDAGEPWLQVQNWYLEQQDSMERLEDWGWNKAEPDSGILPWDTAQWSASNRLGFSHLVSERSHILN